VPTIVIDVKGDLPNLLLAFPDFTPSALEPWVEREGDDMPREAIAACALELSNARRAALAEWGLPRQSSARTPTERACAS